METDAQSHPVRTGQGGSASGLPNPDTRPAARSPMAAGPRQAAGGHSPRGPQGRHAGARSGQAVCWRAVRRVPGAPASPAGAPASPGVFLPTRPGGFGRENRRSGPDAAPASRPLGRQAPRTQAELAAETPPRSPGSRDPPRRRLWESSRASPGGGQRVAKLTRHQPVPGPLTASGRPKVPSAHGDEAAATRPGARRL